MNKSEVLSGLKEVVIRGIQENTPELATDLNALKEKIENELTIDSPVYDLGWDSLQMTWLLLNLEKKFQIDLSTLSTFDLYAIGDLVDEVHKRVEDK